MEGFDHHHHARSTSERSIVDLSMNAESIRAEIADVDLEDPDVTGTLDDAHFERRVEKLWKDG
jgi:hypothetical protein